MYLFLTRNRIRPFREQEDFNFLIGLFQRVMFNLGMVNDKMYDWVAVPRTAMSKKATGVAQL